MKNFITTLKRSVIIFVILAVITGIIYPAVVTAISQLLFNEKANGSIIEIDGKKYGSQLLGQQYNDEKHMWGRIVNLDLESFTDEDGNILMYGKPSNLSVESQQYQQLVQQRIDMIRQANPDMDETKIPVELITCSASGVDPDISYSAAIYQVKRIAENNNMTEQEVLDIIDKCKTEKLLGIFGQETVNVLKVNLMLEGILQ